MRNLILCASLAVAATLGPSIVTADTFKDVFDGTDIVASGRPSPFVQLNAGDSYAGAFDLTEDGYAPGTQLDWAYADFWFMDYLTNGGDETVRIGLGLGNDEFLTVSDISSVVVSVGGSVAEFISEITDDGVLQFRVTALQGNIIFKGGELTAGVPDGGTTVALLGLGLLGLVAVRRKIA